MHVLRPALAAASISLLLAACGSNEQPPSAAPPLAADATLTAGDLSPTFRLLGGDGTMPVGVEIAFRPERVFGDERLAASAVRIDPEIPGTITVLAPNRMQWTPQSPLELSTEYRITLERVASKDGVLTAPSQGWSWTFATPDFKLARIHAQPLEKEGQTVRVDLVFTGAVDTASVKRFLSATVDGADADVALTPGSAPGIVRASISARKMWAGVTVALSLQKGVPQSGATRIAPAANESFTVMSAGAIQIQGAFLRQGSAGPYIEVVCTDSGVGGQRYVYDRETGQNWYVSSRCQPGLLQAKEKIRFDPPLDFTVAPGRAGFDLFGPLGRGEIKLVVDQGLVSLDGGVLGAKWEQSFSVPARTPSVSLVAGGRYLPRSAWRNLAVKHVNVESAELTIRQVTPANLIFWMSDDASEKANERNSAQLLIAPLALSSEADVEKTTWVDVASLLPSATRGVLELSLAAPGVANASRSRILLTDLAVIAKRSVPDPKTPWAEDIVVWVVGIDSTDPVRGAEVTLVRRNGQAVARCNTDGAGTCRLTVTKADSDPSVPFALLARSGEDLTYVKWADLKIEPSEDDVAGEPFLSERPYRATFYTDRGVYRPGDTAHVVALLRGRDGNSPKGGLPVTMKITDPRARLAKRLSLKSNDAGMVSLDLPFDAFADTGKWTIDLEVADSPIATSVIQVEEFVPERMRVEATAKKTTSGFEDEVEIDIAARYLFGGSAVGSDVQMTCELAPTTFRPKLNAGYTYGVWHGQKYVYNYGNGETTGAAGEVRSSNQKATNLAARSGTLDDDGRTSVTCPAPSSAGSFEGPGLLVAKASVFEAGSGRSTLGIAAVPVHPESYYLGLSSKTKQAQTGTPLAVDGIVVDWDGKPVPDGKVSEIAVELVRLEPNWNDYYYEGDGGSSYSYSLQPIAEWSGTVKVQSGGKFQIEVTPREKAAIYLVRASSGKARADLSIPGAYDGFAWNLTDQKMDLTPRPGRPTGLLLDGPAKARVGDPVTVRFKAPYAGKVLLTAETSEVLESEWKKVGAGEVSWTFTLGEFAPNVYVSALLVKDPHLESAKSFLPDRAFGVTSVPVEPTAWHQAVTVTAPAEVRSNSDFEVVLDVGRPADGAVYATIAVVDEGILQLTGFKTPDPLASLFARRALGVETYETIGWTLLVPPAGTTKKHGGDGAAGSAAGRVQPVKPVALWSGVVKVPESGRVAVPFHVPLYRGKLRVMAVTSGAKRIGAASTSVTVVDPIVVQTTLPRFLSFGDTFQVPVFLTNMSGKPLDIDISLSAENLAVPGVDAIDAEPNPIEFIGKPKGRVKLAPAESGTVVFHARAKKMVGAAKFRVLAKGGGFESHDELDVPFLPSGPRDRQVQKVQVAKSGTLDLQGKVSGWLPTSERTTFWVTANPYGEVFTNLQPLIRYPYG